MSAGRGARQAILPAYARSPTDRLRHARRARSAVLQHVWIRHKGRARRVIEVVAEAFGTLVQTIPPTRGSPELG